MTRPPFTFAGALDLLEQDRKKIAGLDKILGGLILAGGAGTAIAGGPVPVIGLSAAAVLSLVDPKNEAIRLLNTLVDGAVGRIKGGVEANQHELVVAAHTITVLSCFFDALRDGPFSGLDLTTKEIKRLAGVEGQASRRRPSAEDLLAADVPLPSAEFGVLENLEQRIIPYYRQLAATSFEFFRGLDAWDRQVRPEGHGRLAEQVVDYAAYVYRGRMLSLSTRAPFALWVTLNEHAATRTAVRAAGASALAELQAVLPFVLRGSPVRAHGYRAELALAAKEVLAEPLLRSGSAGVRSPTVKAGFVEPAFKLAIADEGSRPADDSWWHALPSHESLVDYLAGYLADRSSTELPLLLLGHPGAGKSLLTEVLAAELPSDSFSVVRVPLRRVNTDDDLTVQITKELQRILQRPQADLSELRDECGSCTDCRAVNAPRCAHECRLVVLLDGYDELIQATGVTQSGYLNKIVEFQKRARTLGVPTSVVITTRTVVAQHADIPRNTPILKLCEFGVPRIDRWLTEWNTAHRDVPQYEPLTAELFTQSPSVAELACQPLLLLVLAVYLTEAGTALLEAGSLSQAELYRRILDRFISRQVEKGDGDPDSRQEMVLEALQRKQLQYAASGMFSRGRQHITDRELDADLAVLLPQPDRSTEVAALRQAHQVLGAFMFVHNAKADREQRGAYEFLHATFGEYLVAELTYEQLRRLDALRAVEAAELTPAAAQLDDLALRRVLSHQPLSTRQPTITFLIELTRELDSNRRASLLATITELLHATRTRPDLLDDVYGPSPYDPVRRRACYSANLTLLRVLLDPDPVTPAAIVGSSREADWESNVLLWRAGLDGQAWVSVIESIGAAPTPSLQICARISDYRGLIGEAELLGHREHMATLLLGGHHAHANTFPTWSNAELEAVTELATIHAVRTGVPFLGRVLPMDLGWYQSLVLKLETGTDNEQLGRQVVALLSRDAEYLPVDLVVRLLQAIPSVSAPLGAELAAVAAAHPSVLQLVPTVREAIGEVVPDDGTVVVALLWQAAQRYSGADRDLLTDLLNDVDGSMAMHPNLRFRADYFAPQFVTYLRKAEPEHWFGQHARTSMFDALEPSMLANIDPKDASYIAEAWPVNSGRFIRNYLLGRGIDVIQLDLDPLLELRNLAAQTT
ncbi:NACHT domain-containing protein [Kribbella endophytica]